MAICSRRSGSCLKIGVLKKNHLEEVESDFCQHEQPEHERHQPPTAAAAHIEPAVTEDEDSCFDRNPPRNENSW